MSDALQDAISRKLAAFTAELVELYREALHEAVAKVVGDQKAVALPRAIVRPARSLRVNVGTVSQRITVGPRRRRNPRQIEALASRIEKYVAANPGLSAEAIKKALGIAKNEWNLPVNKLLAEKKIRTTGERRATRYHPVK